MELKMIQKPQKPIRITQNNQKNSNLQQSNQEKKQDVQNLQLIVSIIAKCLPIFLQHIQQLPQALKQYLLPIKEIYKPHHASYLVSLFHSKMMNQKQLNNPKIYIQDTNQMKLFEEEIRTLKLKLQEQSKRAKLYQSLYQRLQEIQIKDHIPFPMYQIPEKGPQFQLFYRSNTKNVKEINEIQNLGNNMIFKKITRNLVKNVQENCLPIIQKIKFKKTTDNQGQPEQNIQVSFVILGTLMIFFDGASTKQLYLVLDSQIRNQVMFQNKSKNFTVVFEFIKLLTDKMFQFLQNLTRKPDKILSHQALAIEQLFKQCEFAMEIRQKYIPIKHNSVSIYQS